MIVPALSNMFSMRVIEGVEHALEGRGFSVLVADSGGDAAREREKVALLRERMADGLVLMPSGGVARAILRAAGKMPVALIDREMDERCFDSVLVENEAGAYRMVRAAIADGARRLGMIAGRKRCRRRGSAGRAFCGRLRNLALPPLPLCLAITRWKGATRACARCSTRVWTRCSPPTTN